jgi:hypothetical protein
MELEASLRQVEQMKKIYEIENRKIKVNGASNWPWFECFNNIFSSIAKISGIPNAINQGVHVMNYEIEVVNVSDEEDVQTPQMPNNSQKQTPVFGDDNASLEIPHLLILIA